MPADKPSEADVSEVEEPQAPTNQDTGQENVKDSETSGEFSPSVMKEITGRDFKDKDDFQKHYKNLSSMVGKKEKTPAKMSNAPDVSELAEFKAEYRRDKFIQKHPESEENFDMLSSFAEKQEISLADAWEKKKDVFIGANAHKNERNIGANPTNRVAPQAQKYQKMMENTKNVSDDQKLDVVANWRKSQDL